LRIREFVGGLDDCPLVVDPNANFVVHSTSVRASPAGVSRENLQHALNKWSQETRGISVLLWTTGLLALTLLASKKRDHAANHYQPHATGTLTLPYLLSLTDSSIQLGLMGFFGV
jgi:hypothetical protein